MNGRWEGRAPTGDGTKAHAVNVPVLLSVLTSDDPSAKDPHLIGWHIGASAWVCIRK